MAFGVRFGGIHICIGRWHSWRIDHSGNCVYLCAGCKKAASKLPAQAVMRSLGYEKRREEKRLHIQDGSPYRAYCGLSVSAIKKAELHRAITITDWRSLDCAPRDDYPVCSECLMHALRRLLSD